MTSWPIGFVVNYFWNPCTMWTCILFTDVSYLIKYRELEVTCTYYAFSRQHGQFAQSLLLLLLTGASGPASCSIFVITASSISFFFFSNSFSCGASVQLKWSGDVSHLMCIVNCVILSMWQEFAAPFNQSCNMRMAHLSATVLSYKPSEDQLMIDIKIHRVILIDQSYECHCVCSPSNI